MPTEPWAAMSDTQKHFAQSQTHSAGAILRDATYALLVRYNNREQPTDAEIAYADAGLIAWQDACLADAVERSDLAEAVALLGKLLNAWSQPTTQEQWRRLWNVINEARQFLDRIGDGT